MSALVKYERFDKDGVELIINMQTGESFASVSGYARMANKDKSTISRRLGTVAAGVVKNAEITTTTGVKTVALIDGKLAMTWLANDNPYLLVAMGEAGWNVYCHKVVGYEYQVVKKDLSKLEILEMALESEKKYLEVEKANAILEHQKRKLETNVVHLEEILVEKEPYAKLGETLVNHDVDTVTVAEFATSLGIGRNRMYEKLREMKFIQQSCSLPYQVHLETGRAKVYRKARPGQPGVYDATPILTAKGQKYICKKLADLERKEVVTVQIESVLTAADF